MKTTVQQLIEALANIDPATEVTINISLGSEPRDWIKTVYDDLLPQYYSHAVAHPEAFADQVGRLAKGLQSHEKEMNLPSSGS